jgi:ubiquinol-cytochrome c reductase cytochrome c1 subunit
MTMKKLVIALFALLLPALASAAGGGANPYIVPAPISITDKAQAQRGAQLFMNYCYGCHSLQYLRYERMATDLDIPLDLLAGNLMFNTDKPGDPIISPIDPVEAKKWFGAAPPDLTLEARLRGADWIYSYLISFYPDETRPTGVNNHVFPAVGMPHVMADLQSNLPEEEFKAKMADITAFLEYAADPIQVQRITIGIFVIGFLLVLLVFTWLMKREYWKDVH